MTQKAKPYETCKGMSMSEKRRGGKRKNAGRKVSVVSGRHSKKLGGNYFESFSLLPWIRIAK